ALRRCASARARHSPERLTSPAEHSVGARAHGLDTHLKDSPHQPSTPWRSRPTGLVGARPLELVFTDGECTSLELGLRHYAAASAVRTGLRIVGRHEAFVLLLPQQLTGFGLNVLDHYAGEHILVL